MPRLARQTWMGQTMLGPALLLAALAPMYLYAGHWSMFFEAALGHSVSDADEAEHVEHCHLGVANCAEQPIPEGVRVIPALVDVPEPDLSSTPIEGANVYLNEHIDSPPTEPPRL